MAGAVGELLAVAGGREAGPAHRVEVPAPASAGADGGHPGGLRLLDRGEERRPATDRRRRAARCGSCRSGSRRTARRSRGSGSRPRRMRRSYGPWWGLAGVRAARRRSSSKLGPSAPRARMRSSRARRTPPRWARRRAGRTRRPGPRLASGRPARCGPPPRRPWSAARPRPARRWRPARWRQRVPVAPVGGPAHVLGLEAEARPRPRTPVGQRGPSGRPGSAR